MKTKAQIYTTAPELSKTYLTAHDLASLLGISLGFSYRLIREMNLELRQKSYLTISGKIPTRYFEEKWYGLKETADNNKGRVAK